MNYKTALVILLIIILIVIFIFLLISQGNDIANILRLNTQEKNVENIIDLKNQGKNLTSAQETVLEGYIDLKISEKQEVLQKNKNQLYSQDDLEFIANPRATIEKEMGISSQPKEVKIYTQEELDKIANPSRY
ncbi:MAG: hypothetical protein ABH830_03695 [Patescibacteria group bacterium]